MLETCGDAENQLALEPTQHEVFVEGEIVEPLCSIAEVGAFAAWHRRAKTSVGCVVNVVLVSTVLTVTSGFDVHFFLEIRGRN